MPPMKIPGMKPPPPEGDELIEPFVLPEPVNPDFYDPAWDAWKPTRRIPPKYIVIGVAIVVVAVGLVYLVRGLTANNYSKAIVKPSLTPTTFTIATSTATPTPTTFSGTRSETTQTFSVPGGLGVVGATCQCTGTTFQVRVIGTNGNVAAIPINSLGAGNSGTFAGSVPLGVGAGTYALKITASGKWSVNISYPPATLPALALPEPQLFTGVGPTVIGPLSVNQKYGVAYSIVQQPNPVSLQVVYDDGTLGPVIFNVTQTPKTEYLPVPAQSKPFYLSLSDAPQRWGIYVARE